MLPPQNRLTSASGDRPARPNGRRGSVGLPTTPGRWSYEVTSFSCELHFDHLCNEAMLVAQELHHFEGCWDCVGYRGLGGMPPLAIQ